MNKELCSLPTALDVHVETWVQQLVQEMAGEVARQAYVHPSVITDYLLY
jgi:hypothetical protein